MRGRRRAGGRMPRHRVRAQLQHAPHRPTRRLQLPTSHHHSPRPCLLQVLQLQQLTHK